MKHKNYSLKKRIPDALAFIRKLLIYGTILAVGIGNLARAQTSGSLLAMDDFNTTTGALHGKASGSGWSSGWFTQNSNTAVPGYNVASATPLQYSSLSVSGNYVVGGNAYLAAGRGFDVSATGPFASYLTGGNIGVSGKTLYISALMRKSVNNSDEASISLHSNTISWYANPALLSAGYFGSTSDNGGIRYWSLRIGSTVYRSNIAITAGQTALLVLKIEFGTTNNISLYVNPATLGGSTPASSNASGSISTSIAFKSLSYYGGNVANQSALDEIRVGASFAAVTPAVDATAPSIPASLSASGITSTSASLSWAASTDNTGVTGYEVFRNGVSIATPSINSYTATALTCGTSYAFTVRARDAAGNWSAQSSALNVITSACPDVQAPSTPSNLSISRVTTNSAQLSWSPATDNVGVTGYEIFRNGVSTGTTSATTLAISDLMPSTSYSLTVRARDAAGNWSAQSAAISLTTQSPAPVGNLLAFDDFNTASGPLNGKASGGGWSSGWFTQNSDETIPGYNVSNTSPLQFSNLYTSGNYAVGGNAYLTTGRSFNLSANGPFSGYLIDGNIGASGKTLYLSALLSKSVSNGDEVSISLHSNASAWHADPALVSVGYFGAASDNGGIRYWSLRVGSSIYRSNNAIASGQAALLVLKIEFGSINNLTLYVNPSSLGAAAPSTASASGSISSGIAFKSLAFYGGNGANQGALDEIRIGDSFASVTPTAPPVADISAPSVPTNVASSSITQTSLALTWAASTDNIGVTGYEVFRNGVSIATTITNSYSAASLSCGTAYSFTVRARDAAGNWSAQSAALNATTATCGDTQAPSVPGGVTASNITLSSINLSWTASTDNTGVTGYEIFRNGVSLATSSTNSYTAASLSCGTAYSFTVRARDAAGNWSAQSTALNASTLTCSDTQAPSVPTGLSASNVLSSSITLSWLASVDNAGGSGVTGYEVYRNGIAEGVTSNITFTVSGLLPSTNYSFAVRARDAAGNWSAQSSPVSVATTSAPQTGNRAYSIGVNTNSTADYNIDKPFANAMLSHRQWNRIGDGQGSGTSSIPLDANGWPAQDGTALVYHGLNTHNNQGTYKLSFTGQADLSVTGGGASYNNKQYNSTTNTTTADLIISDINNLDLWITFTNTRRTGTSATNTGVTNVKLMRPVTPGSTQSYPVSRIYMDDYINKLAAFKAIRFMGWSSANWCPDQTWANHLTWNYATQFRNDPASGRTQPASWESVILLANAANRDAWITLPHMANDQYINNVALMFKYGSDGVNPYTSPQTNPVVPPLNSNLKLYVEYSNEVWNNDFSQTQWTRDAGSTYGQPLNFDGESDVVTLGFRYKAMRTVQISNIFRTVFGDGEMPAPGKLPEEVRVRPLVCWQLGYNDLTNRTLSFIDRYYNKRDSRSNWSDPHPVSYYIYGGGGSGYWYTDGNTAMTADNLWNNGTWNPTEYANQLFRDAAWVKAFGLTYVAYEGDNHPSGAGYGGSNNDAAIMAQTHWDQRMYAETEEHLKAFSSLEGDLFCFLVLQNMPTNSFWGVYNLYNGLTSSPQYQVIQALNGTTSTASISKGSVVPFTRAGSSFDVSTYESPNPGGTGTHNLTANASNFASAYSFRTNETNTNNVRVEYSTNAAATLTVEFAGKVIGTFNLASTNGASAFTPSINIQCVSDRLYAIRVVCTSGAVTIRNIIVNSGSVATASAARQSLAADVESADVYPNPVRDKVVVTMLSETGDDYQTETAEVTIMDMMRKTLSKKRQTLQKGYNSIQLDTQELADGFYFMVIQKGNQRIVKRFLVVREGTY